jgi:hypothetical protein
MLEICTDEIKRHELNVEKYSSPNHSNNDVSNSQGTDKGPDVRGDGFFFAVGEGESQDDEDKEQLHADLCVIGQRPFHGVGVVEGVADTDEGDAGDGGGEGRMDKTV